jgi:hypothetical protein
MSKGKILKTLLIILGVIMISAVGFGIWKINKEIEKITKGTSESVIPKKVKTGEIDTSDWKTYRNEQFGFEVKYPPNYEILGDILTQSQFHKSDPEMDRLNQGLPKGLPIYLCLFISMESFEHIKYEGGDPEPTIKLLENAKVGEEKISKGVFDALNKDTIIEVFPGVKGFLSLYMSAHTGKYVVDARFFNKKKDMIELHVELKSTILEEAEKEEGYIIFKHILSTLKFF